MLHLLLEVSGQLRISFLSLADFLLDGLLQLREVGRDAVRDHLNALVSRLSLLVQVTPQLVFLGEEGV